MYWSNFLAREPRPPEETHEDFFTAMFSELANEVNNTTDCLTVSASLFEPEQPLQHEQLISNPFPPWFTAIPLHHPQPSSYDPVATAAVLNNQPPWGLGLAPDFSPWIPSPEAHVPAMMPLQFGNNEDVFQPSASPLQLCKNEDVFQPSASPSPPTLPPSPVSVSTTAGAPSEPDLGSSRNKFIHECSHCPRSFTRRYNLLAHIRGTHSLEKPYTCALCPRAFTRKHDFDRHAVSCHWKVKPFQCPRCSRRFARSDALKKHGRRKQCKDPDSD